MKDIEKQEPWDGEKQIKIGIKQPKLNCSWIAKGPELEEPLLTTGIDQKNNPQPATTNHQNISTELKMGVAIKVEEEPKIEPEKEKSK